MTRKKVVYRIIALLAILLLISVSVVVMKKPTPDFVHTPQLQDHIEADSVTHRIDKLTENKAAVDPTLDLRYGKKKDYMRVVFEGPQEILTLGKVRREENEVRVTFPDIEFSLKEGKSPIPFRREKDTIIFHQDKIEKIRVLNLSDPTRLVIDFYTVKANIEQEKTEHTEKNKDLISNEVNARIADIVEKVQHALDKKEKKAEAQRLEITKKVLYSNKNKEEVSKGINLRLTEMLERVLLALDDKKQNEEEQSLGQPVLTSAPEIAVSVKAVPPMPEVKSLIDQKKAEVAGPEIEDTNERLALLLFDNFSGNKSALDTIMPLILNQLENRGYDVVDYEEVEAYLCERRIRNSTFLPRKVAAELGKEKMVTTVVAGSVLTFIADGNPKIGILARQLDLRTGQVIWSDFVSLTGEDYTRMLGLGTIKSIDKLLPHALNNLFAAFGDRSREEKRNSKYNIAVLPFKNATKQRNAGIIITHLFQNELANNPVFNPADYGDVKNTLVNLRVGRKGEVDNNDIQDLSQFLDVDVVLTGTVEEYQSGKDNYSPPVVTISARLLDTRNNRIIWYDNLQLDGEDTIIALDWGRLRSADKVAYGAVSGLVDNIETESLLR